MLLKGSVQRLQCSVFQSQRLSYSNGTTQKFRGEADAGARLVSVTVKYEVDDTGLLRRGPRASSPRRAST